MKSWFTPLLTAALVAAMLPRIASAESVPVGYMSFDVTAYSNQGVPELAEIDVFNLTGPNSFAPDFPVGTPLSFSNVSLALTYAGGQTATLGSSYFTLDADGLSLDGTALSDLLGYPGGLANVVTATLTGTVNASTIFLYDGTQTLIQPNFSATISDPSGLSDGDLAIIDLTATPEPGTWLLCGTGLAGLIFLRRRQLQQLALARVPGRLWTGALAGLILLAAARPGAAVTLGAWTSPNSGTAGVSSVTFTGSGFPSGSIPAANVTLTLAPVCGSAGTPATVNSVTTVVGSTDRVSFAVPASLGTATYYVSLSGTSAGGASFASTNCTAINVTGSAVPVATLSGTSVSFSSLAAGSSAANQVVTLSNTGTGPLSVTGITLSGTGANLFPASNNCPATLSTGAYCTITIGFAPLVPGSYSASVSVATSASTQSVALSGSATPAALTINTTNATDWKISNGALNLDFNPSKGRIFHIFLAGHSDDLTDQTNSSAGIYMDNSGFGTGTVTTGYDNAGSFLDWWVTTASSSTNAYTYSMHFVVFPNDPGVHMYFVANHSATDVAGGIGQVQWVYRSNLNDFTNTYSVNQDLSNPGPVIVPLPTAAQMFSTDPGRAVSDATVDLHGFTLPAGFTRGFYTKYDYSQYNYLHQAHGVFGPTFGNWAYFPSNESTVGGPTKQNLIYTGNLTIIEAFSNHYDNNMTDTAVVGTASSRLFGPFYLHFNAIGQAFNSTGSPINTPDDMYADTLAAGAALKPLYDNETDLLTAGYTPSTQRGTVSIQVNNIVPLTNGTPKTAWAVLSDPATNFQYSNKGYQYWADISQTGTATFNGVVPGTYRLSVFVLGQWGELRQDGITVSANQTLTVPAVTFVPENFGTETVFTIGTPDRSSHEFLHGHDAQGHDVRNFWGSYNYWADFASTNGAVVYNATAGPNGPATNDLTKWNYNHWGVFDPGLFGGVYNSSDDTTDGYKYVIPAYVAGLSGASGTNGVSTHVPAWTVHFATPADVANYQYAVLSIAMACDYGSYVADLNGTHSTQARTWSYDYQNDCSVRSGLSGFTQWFTMQFPVASLNPAGQDNVLTLGVSQTYGPMDDALRLELSNTGSSPAVTGWNDYDYVPTNSGTTRGNDALPNP